MPSSVPVEGATSAASAICFPGEDTAREAFLSRLPTPPDLNITSSRQGQLQAVSNEAALSKLRSTACLRDLARLTALSAPHAGAWLRALPAPALGLAILSQEHVLALRLWLGITTFPPPPGALRCVCGVQLDPFGDHLLGCGHGVLRIQRHDALRDIVYHALRMDNPGVRTEQRCQGDHQDRPGDIFHPDFQDGRPAYSMSLCVIPSSLLSWQRVPSAQVSQRKLVRLPRTCTMPQLWSRLEECSFRWQWNRLAYGLHTALRH